MSFGASVTIARSADAISLQGELASSIADALDATLSPQERWTLRSKPTRNPDAYVLYLRATKIGARSGWRDREL